LTTEQDGRIEAQRALADHWKALGLDAEFIVTPNIGHWYPADFARQLDRAIGRIVARRRARSSDARDRHERAPSRRQLCH
jgi:hypothetical protein